MTNKEKALELIERAVNIDISNEDDIVVGVNDIKKAIELASKPDWFHPSKGEFPELQIHGSFLLSTCELVLYHDDTCCYCPENEIFIFWDEIEAWAYLPTYKLD